MALARGAGRGGARGTLAGHVHRLKPKGDGDIAWLIGGGRAHRGAPHCGGRQASPPDRGAGAGQVRVIPCGARARGVERGEVGGEPLQRLELARARLEARVGVSVTTSRAIRPRDGQSLGDGAADSGRGREYLILFPHAANSFWLLIVDSSGSTKNLSINLKLNSMIRTKSMVEIEEGVP